MSANTTGTVYLLGAGPGDPELITMKARRLLVSADAVVYDNLVADELVVTLPATIERYYVGKRPGSVCNSQEDINALLVRLAKEGKTVARLKGADPLIFGRGGEEARFLREHGIPFVIVPGITAGIAAPAYAGIPCTDRERASYVVFATGHPSREKSASSVPWDWVAQATTGTVVIYMGVAQAEDVMRRLTNAGMPPDHPAAVIERGTYPTQRVVKSTVAELPRAMKREHIKAPAIIILGRVIEVQPWLHWWDNLPLMGKRILVTRPVHQAHDMYQSLRELGAEVMPYPTITVNEHHDRKAWDHFLALEREGWLVFTSENGVNFFMKQFFEHVDDVRSLARFKLAVIGTGTMRALEQYHLQPDSVPTKQTGEGLAEELVRFADFNGVNVVRVRGNLAFSNVEDALRDVGAHVITLTTYNTELNTWSPDHKEALLERPPDIITFTSGTTCDGLLENLTTEELRQVTESAIIASIGPTTTRTVEAHGMTVTIEPNTHSIPALIDAIVQHASSAAPGTNKGEEP
jgi:uroporphyrinogen III methyltransferase / synthase